jgi:hypothetical protein
VLPDPKFVSPRRGSHLRIRLAADLAAEKDHSRNIYIWKTDKRVTTVVSQALTVAKSRLVVCLQYWTKAWFPNGLVWLYKSIGFDKGHEPSQ